MIECNDYKLLRRRYGEIAAKKIRQRLDDLLNADHLHVMTTLPGRCHELKGNRQGQLSLDLDHPRRLIFIPADISPALNPEGGIDWKNVRSVEILGIEDTHE